MINRYETEGAAEYVNTLFTAPFTGVCVDIGAFDPFWISNSWLLEKSGWDTYCIEPNPNCIARLKQFRKNVLEFACGKENKDDADLYTFRVDSLGVNGEAAGTGLTDHRKNPTTGIWHSTLYSTTVKVKVRTLDWLMENIIKKDKINFLSIDVERSEMDVLRGTSFDRWKPDVIAIENIDKEENQIAYLKAKGYRYVHRIIFNDFYMSDEYYKEFMS